jgi:hypothetical protein
MFLLKDKLRQIIAHKHLSKAMIGSIALHAVRQYFGFTNNTLLIDGYVKFDKLFLITTEQHLKIEIFQKKPELLKKINDALEKIGYTKKITEIFIK